MTKPRVIIADDHRLFVAGLEQLLAPECDIVSTACDGPTLLNEVRRLRPDIVVQDISMPPANGMDLLREIVRIDSRIRVVIVTMHAEPELAAEAFRRGASAFILKNCAVSELLAAVHSAMERRSYITPFIASGMIKSLASRAHGGDADQHLTGRQREVLRLLAEGQSMKEIAAALNLTARTVAFHRYRMMHALNIKTSAALVRFAVAQHIV